jgi:hypothetical protein
MRDDKDGQSALADDILDGIKAISRFTGRPERRLYYLAEKNLLRGVFKEGSRWIGLKSVIRESLESAARGES